MRNSRGEIDNLVQCQLFVLNSRGEIDILVSFQAISLKTLYRIL